MKKSKIVIAVALSFVFLMLTCGCGGTLEKYKNAENPISEKLANEAATVASGVVAENNTFSLIWDNENVCIQLLNKQNGDRWSSTPCNADGSYIEDAENVFSPIDIDQILYSGYKTVKLEGKKYAIDNGAVSAKKIENGLEVTFIFLEQRISIPVEFVLKEDGLQASVKLDGIVEDYRDRKVFRITLLPYFCSVPNANDNYIFVPSGSGALMYTDERSAGLPREFEGKVYGQDPTQEIAEKQTSGASICMPVYGAKSFNSTLSAIIINGAERSTIYAQAGNASLGCSYVCNSFQIRGYNGTILQYGGVTGNKLVEQYTREMDDISQISVEFKPSLTTNEQGYNFIANEYRKYLIKHYKIGKTNTESSVLSLKILGGMQVKKHIFGIPNLKVEPLTTFTDAKSIIKKVSSLTDSFDVQLVGFGNSGIDYGQLGGGFSFSKELGNKRSLEELQDYCSKTSINLFFDYELLTFHKSGNGFATSSDNSVTANQYPAKVYEYSPVTGSKDDQGISAAILKRDRLFDAVKKSVKATKNMKWKGISLSSLSNTAYSDYNSEMKYSNCNLINKDIKNFFKYIKENDLKIAASAANDYAAALSDKIFDSPSNDAMSLAFDCTVPFYQIVFKGFVDHSMDSINTATDFKKQVLKSIETGSALQFSIIQNYKSEYAFYHHKDLQFMIFQNNIDKIENTLHECGDFLESVKNAKITDHILLREDVRKTVFDNGINVYVNYGDTDYKDSEIFVKSMSFKVGDKS